MSERANERERERGEGERSNHVYTRAFFCDSSREPRASTRLVVCLSGWDV